MLRWRASPEGNASVDKDARRALSYKRGGSICKHVSPAAKTISEDKDVGVTSRRDRKRAEEIDADGDAGALGQGHRNDEPEGRQPRDFPCLTYQALPNPPTGADVHTNPPVEPLEQ